MAGNVGIPSPNDLNELFISVNTAWTTMDLTRNTQAETLSYFVNSPKSDSLSLPLINSSSAPYLSQQVWIDSSWTHRLSSR